MVGIASRSPESASRDSTNLSGSAPALTYAEWRTCLYTMKAGEFPNG
jgi:hypothetical protein